MVSRNSGEILMQWLFKQKYRIDRGYQLLGLINLCLLLAQSETLKRFLGISSAYMLVFGVPVALTSVWLCGYIITRPAMQKAEDRALAETIQNRRDIDEILSILRSMKQ